MFPAPFLRYNVFHMYYVYVIQSEKNKKLYFGFTNNLNARLESHNNGGNKSTKFSTPWRYVYFEGYRSEKDARLREKKLKHYGNARSYIKLRIKNCL